MNEQTLKEKLRAIRENNFAVPPEIEAFELAQEMLNYIGSTDSELRDRLIYSVFVRWIELNPVFSPEQLRYILTTVLDNNHLGCDISKPESDSVFTRSFSVLLVPVILISHRENPFLNHLEVLEIKAQLLHYLEVEKDLRGFVPGKGWVHAVAHTADALNELALCDELDQKDLLDILEAVRGKIASPTTVYIHGEDSRFGEIFDSVLSRQLLNEEQLDTWLAGFLPLIQQSEPEGYYQFINVKNFMQSLYFLCHQRHLPDFASNLIARHLQILLEQWQ